MTDSFSADTQKLRAGSEVMAEVHRRLDTNLEEIRTLVGRAGQVWRSDSSSTFQQLAKQWDDQASGLQQILGSLSQELAQDSTALEKLEEQTKAGLEQAARTGQAGGKYDALNS